MKYGSRSVMVRRNSTQRKHKDRQLGKRMSLMPIPDNDFPMFRIMIRGKLWYVQERVRDRGFWPESGPMVQPWEDVSRGIVALDDARRAMSIKAAGAGRKLTMDIIARRVSEA